MNKNSMYVNGKIIISDENGEQTTKTYTDNIKEILEKENLIEHLETEKGNIINILYKLKTRKSDNFFLIPLVFMLLMTIFIFLSPIKFNLGILAIYLATSAGITAAIFTVYLKWLKKYKNGLKNKFNFLDKELKIEEENLLQLKNDKSKDNEKNMKDYEFIKLNDKKDIREIDRQSNLYFDIGRHEKRLAKYYNLGMLKKYLNKIFESYNDSDIGQVENYLKEKCQAKAKVNNKKEKRIL